MNSTLFIEILGALGGYEFIKWLVNYITHRKHEKQLKETEVDKAKSDVGKSKVAEEKALRDMYEETLQEMRKEYVERINELRQANSELSKQNIEILKAGARKDEIIEDKIAKIRELNEQLVIEVRKNGELEKQAQFFETWHCERETGKGKEQCMRRKPQQNPPLKYRPIEKND